MSWLAPDPPLGRQPPLSPTALLDLPHAFGPPPAHGHLRAAPEDFVVIEDLGFEPSGDGDHVFVRVRKREANTEWVARRLAEFAGVRPRYVSYAGLKDRAAVAEQTFSVLLPGRRELDWSSLANPEFEVLAAARNRRKLRHGALAGNRFRLVVREVAAPDGGPVDRGAVDARLARVAATGVPNYFGPQRFGIDGGNLAKAAALFTGEYRERDRHKRGLYYSAARSHVFNRVLAHRVGAGLWNQAVQGDAMMLDGSRSFFIAETIDAEIERRLHDFDIHPTGPLWGKGEAKVVGEARRLEEAVLAPLAFWCEGLVHEALDQSRRALRVRVAELAWDWADEATLILAFHLPPGAYATTVLREVVAAESLESFAERDEP